MPEYEADAEGAAIRELVTLRARVLELEHELGQCPCNVETGAKCPQACTPGAALDYRQGEAYKAGERAGRADRYMGRRSVVAWITEPREGYAREYSLGYHAGWGREA